MERIVISALAMILWFGLVAADAQTGPTAADPALQAAIETRQKAILSRNTADWLKHTSEDFVLINSRGEIESRDARLKVLINSKGTGVVAVTESLRTYGADAAVMIQRSGAGSQNPTLTTSVWVRQSGVWQVVSTQFTSIAK
jgi:hypothetical protein